MSNLINFLENLGQNAKMRRASRPTLYNAMNEHKIDAGAQWAVLRGDPAHLATMLNARTDMGCLMMAPQAHVEQTIEQTGYFAKTG